MDTVAPVSVCVRMRVNRFDPYPALQFAFMAGDIFDIPNKISHRAEPTNFLILHLYCFQSNASDSRCPVEYLV